MHKVGLAILATVCLAVWPVPLAIYLGWRGNECVRFEGNPVIGLTMIILAVAVPVFGYTYWIEPLCWAAFVAPFAAPII